LKKLNICVEVGGIALTSTKLWSALQVFIIGVVWPLVQQLYNQK